MGLEANLLFRSFPVGSELFTMAKPHAPRNSTLPGGISRFGRAAVYKKRALYKRKKVATKAAVKDAVTTKVKPIGGDKNGKERTVPLTKESRWYPTEDVKKPLRNRKTPRPTKLRNSLTPGTVCILLAGRHRGKRVVFLKQLDQSGLLLVTGPYKVNGVPLRRIPQSYVIATQTKIDISKVNLSYKLNDAFFKRTKKAKRSSDAIFEDSATGYKVSDERKAEQETVDAAVLAVIAKEPQLKKYMSQLFTLRRGQYPHEMVF